MPFVEADVNFPAVIRALTDTGYKGFLSPEIDYDPNQPDQLTKAAAQLDKIMAA